ncbi:MAG: HD domain-containing protein [bacterium]|nr:HD domain-containing protein [bacterium]
MKREDHWIKDLLDLKRSPRVGWFRAGIDRPESVADHSLAVGLLAWRLARKRGLDAEKALLLGVLHDFHEAQLGDIPSPVKSRLPEGALASTEADLIREQWTDVAPGVAEQLVAMESGGGGPEAELVRAVDGLELLLQARRYRAAGYECVDEFLEDLENREDLRELLDELNG